MLISRNLILQGFLKSGSKSCKPEVTFAIHQEKHNPDGTGGCVKKYLWNSKNFDIMGTETPEPGERQEDKCT